MKVTVKEGCISCGLCAEEYPDLFHLNGEGVAESVGQVPAGQEDPARPAAAGGPVGASTIANGPNGAGGPSGARPLLYRFGMD